MFTKPLSPWKAISVTYFCVCVCARARARLGEGMRMRAEFVCVCACTGVCGYTSAGVCLRACRLTYPVRHSQAPYCLHPLWLHHVCRNFLINNTNFGKKLLNIKCVSWCTLQLLSEIFLIASRNQRDIVINVKTPLCQSPVIFVRF